VASFSRWSCWLVQLLTLADACPFWAGTTRLAASGLPVVVAVDGGVLLAWQVLARHSSQRNSRVQLAEALCKCVNAVPGVEEALVFVCALRVLLGYALVRLQPLSLCTAPAVNAVGLSVYPSSSSLSSSSSMWYGEVWRSMAWRGVVVVVLSLPRLPPRCRFIPALSLLTDCGGMHCILAGSKPTSTR
jgi:hypothetical protein